MIHSKVTSQNNVHWSVAQLVEKLTNSHRVLDSIPAKVDDPFILQNVDKTTNNEISDKNEYDIEVYPTQVIVVSERGDFVSSPVSLLQLLCGWNFYRHA